MTEAVEAFLGVPWSRVANAVIETVYMVSVSLIIGTVAAFIIAILLMLCRKGGLYQNSVVYNVLNFIINIVRSTPFVVLLIAVMPLTKAVIGTRIGPTAAIVPLTISIIPLLVRLMENSLLGVGNGIIEAALAMGASPVQIVFRFILPEALGSLILSLTTGIVGLIGSSAMAGYIGGGGIGSLVLNYGYNRFKYKLMYTLVVLLIVITQIIQSAGNSLAGKWRSKK